MTDIHQEKKDNAHMWYGLSIAAVIAVGIAFAVWQNGQENERVRIAAYAGRRIDPDRTAVTWIVVATVIAVALVAIAWRYTVQRANATIARTPDTAELDRIFSGATLVPVHGGHAGMAHAVLVVGARERGYTLASQGEDGSMVFKRESLLGQRAGESAVSAE